MKTRCWRNVWALTVMINAMTSSHASLFDSADFQFKALAEQAFDDNINFVDADKKNDSITTLTGGLALLLEEERRKFKISGDVSHHFFARNTNFDNTSQSAALAFDNEFSPYSRVSVNDAFSHTAEPQTFEEQFGRVGGRFDYYRNRLRAAYNRDVSPRVTLGAKYRNEIDRSSRADTQSSYLNSGGATADFAWSSSFKFLTEYAYVTREFNPGGTAQIHKAAGGVRKYLTPQLYFEGWGGENFARSYNARQMQNVLYSAALVNDFSARSRGTVSFMRDYELNHYTEDIFDFWRAAGDWWLEMSERTGAGLSGFYAQGSYAAFNIADKLWGGSVTLSYELTPYSKFNASYTHTDFDSNASSRDYKKNRFFLSIGVDL